MYYCANSSNMRNLHEQVKKAFCYEKLFWPFTVWINCSSDLKKLSNSRLSVFSLEFQQFLSITRTIFSHSRSEVRTILVTKYLNFQIVRKFVKLLGLQHISAIAIKVRVLTSLQTKRCKSKMWWRYLEELHLREERNSWISGPTCCIHLYNNLSICVRLSVRTLSPPTFMVRFEL